MTATASRVDITAVKARHSLATVVESAGVKLHAARAASGRGCARSTTRRRAVSRSTPTRSGGTALAAVRAATCWISSSGRSRCRSAEALQLLGGGASTALPRAPLENVPAVSELPERDPALLTAASRFYTGQLLRSAEALAYLSGRGIAVATAIALGLGYAPGAGTPRGAARRRLRRRARRPLRAVHGTWHGTVRGHDHRAR